LEHPPYSSHLAPRDFFLFQKIYELLKGKHFHDTDDIRSNAMAVLKAIVSKGGLGAGIGA
jgi:hypothetical protein